MKTQFWAAEKTADGQSGEFLARFFNQSRLTLKKRKQLDL
jgi:hypothetical protein